MTSRPFPRATTGGDRSTKVERAAEVIRRAGAYRWVGIYEVDGKEIAAVAWSGASGPVNLRFPIDQGLCGAAVYAGTTIVIGDVTKDPRYLTTFDSTWSEIVVPFVCPVTEISLGVIDVESERLNALTEDDRVILEECT